MQTPVHNMHTTVDTMQLKLSTYPPPSCSAQAACKACVNTFSYYIPWTMALGNYGR